MAKTDKMTQKEMLQSVLDRLEYIEARQERTFRKLNIIMEAAWFLLRRGKRDLQYEQARVSKENPRAFYSRVERPQFAEEVIDNIKCDQENGDTVKPLRIFR